MSSEETELELYCPCLYPYIFHSSYFSWSGLHMASKEDYREPIPLCARSLSTLIHATEIFHLDFWHRNPRGSFLSLLPHAHPFTEPQLDLSVRNVLPPFKGCSHCTQMKSHLHNAISEASMIWPLSVLPTTSDVSSFIILWPQRPSFISLNSLIYGFITSDTPHTLLSQWISSALPWLLPVILNLEMAS